VILPVILRTLYKKPIPIQVPMDCRPPSPRVFAPSPRKSLSLKGEGGTLVILPVILRTSYKKPIPIQVLMDCRPPSPRVFAPSPRKSLSLRERGRGEGDSIATDSCELLYNRSISAANPQFWPETPLVVNRIGKDCRRKWGQLQSARPRRAGKEGEHSGCSRTTVPDRRDRYMEEGGPDCGCFAATALAALGTGRC
jgi:hypothetical protein